METASRETIFTSDSNQSSARKWRSAFSKRAFDICASALGLLFLSPIFAMLALAIKRDSRGPVFYRGPRLGRGDQPFGILKFRTMREEAASYQGPRVTAEGDPRVTPLGKWLRDTKLNELPQLWNVLVGEMSLVGPRPEDPSLAEAWPQELRAEVLSLRPGITSPASVLFRDEEKLLSGQSLMETYLGDITPSKLRLDQLYVRHRSFLLDLDVLLWTILVVIVPNLREKKPPEDYLFWGPISRLGRLYFSWFLIDALTTLTAFGIVGGFFRLFIGPLDLGFFSALVIALGYSLLFSSIAALTGAQNISWSNASASDILDLLPPLGLSFVVAMGLNYWARLLPTHVLMDATLVAFAGFVFTRYRSRLFTGLISRWVNRPGANLGLRERVLIMGAGETGQYAAWRMSHGRAAHNFQVIGFADDDMFRQGARLNGFNVLGRSGDIPELVRKYDIGLILFAINKVAVTQRKALLQSCRATGARVVTWPDMPGLIRRLVGEEGTTETAQPESSAPESPALSENLELVEWLDDLEEDLTQGDYSAALEHIYQMRDALESSQISKTGNP